MKQIIIGFINIVLTLTVIGQTVMYNMDKMPGDQYFSSILGYFIIWAIINFVDDTESDAVNDAEDCDECNLNPENEH